MEVEGAPDWVGEYRNAGHAARKIVPGHTCLFLKDKSLDERVFGSSIVNVSVL
jgi:hypothetical protein